MECNDTGQPIHSTFGTHRNGHFMQENYKGSTSIDKPHGSTDAWDRKRLSQYQCNLTSIMAHYILLLSVFITTFYFILLTIAQLFCIIVNVNKGKKSLNLLRKNPTVRIVGPFLV